MTSKSLCMKIIVTGGAGFIGSALVRHLISHTEHEVLAVDKLTYAANLASLSSVQGHPRFSFSKTDICDRPAVTKLFAIFNPDAVMHLAAESHVDRSIDKPAEFIATNILGTYNLLEISLDYWHRLGSRAHGFRFHHVSTDEVYGVLTGSERFTEHSKYDPRSPYSATKAASDHLVRAWGNTYGFPYLLSNCSNNYGPYQFPEKLIPLTIVNCLANEPIPIYGRGINIRDWLFVTDHANALTLILEQGRVAETYNIGGNAERRNIDVVNAICDIMDRLAPSENKSSYRNLINFAPDRPGHDFRYAVDFSKLNRDLNWSPKCSFESGLLATAKWYIENRAWWEPLVSRLDATIRRGSPIRDS
jgi:dTDP-glucose 4,6-dehydratase